MRIGSITGGFRLPMVLAAAFLGLAGTALMTAGCSQTPSVIPVSSADRLAIGEHMADLGDVKLWYKVAGHGPRIIVSSVSWGAGSAYLQHPNGIAPLEQHFTLIYVNARGTPPSTRPSDETQMSTSVVADDLEKLRVYLNLPQVDLLGHSAGAMIVLGYAERYPEHARKLVLLDGAPLDTFPSPRLKEIIDSWRGDPRYAAAIARHDHSEFPPTDAGFSQYLADILPLYFRDPERYAPQFAQTMTKPMDYWASVHNDAADKLAPMPQSQLLGQVTAQTLVIVGRADFICPVEDSERIAQGIPGAKLVIFERSGHMVWIEERERFFNVVSDFLRG